MMGAKTTEQMEANLKVLEMDSLNDSELARMKIIGDYVYKKKGPRKKEPRHQPDNN